jgi:hypothetical protein
VYFRETFQNATLLQAFVTKKALGARRGHRLGVFENKALKRIFRPKGK